MLGTLNLKYVGVDGCHLTLDEDNGNRLLSVFGMNSSLLLLRYMSETLYIDEECGHIALPPVSHWLSSSALTKYDIVIEPGACALAYKLFYEKEWYKRYEYIEQEVLDHLIAKYKLATLRINREDEYKAIFS
ncbi:MAG: hypothetical protein DRQ35_01380 [Gammaproteobacteria bacterium]|nr:MAG: hypothetical protein DRQ35_01380 [Gammaproteobacteria bacterium]